MFRDAGINPPTFPVLSHFKSSQKNATETFFLQAVPFCVSFVVLASQTDCCSQSTSPSLSMYLDSWAVFACFLPFPSCLPFASFSWHRDFHCWPSSFFSCSGLPSRPLASFPPCLLAHQALYLLNATTTRPHPASPAASSCSSSASYVSGRPCSTISSGGLGVRVSTLSLKLPPSPPA